MQTAAGRGGDRERWNHLVLRWRQRLRARGLVDRPGLQPATLASGPTRRGDRGPALVALLRSRHRRCARAASVPCSSRRRRERPDASPFAGTPTRSLKRQPVRQNTNSLIWAPCRASLPSRSWRSDSTVSRMPYGGYAVLDTAEPPRLSTGTERCQNVVLEKDSFSS